MKDFGISPFVWLLPNSLLKTPYCIIVECWSIGMETCNGRSGCVKCDESATGYGNGQSVYSSTPIDYLR